MHTEWYGQGQGVTPIHTVLTPASGIKILVKWSSRRSQAGQNALQKVLRSGIFGVWLHLDQTNATGVKGQHATFTPNLYPGHGCQYGVYWIDLSLRGKVSCHRAVKAAR